jgi:hypothetical protein
MEIMEEIKEETQQSINNHLTEEEKKEKLRLLHNARVKKYYKKRYENDETFRKHRIQLVRNNQIKHNYKGVILTKEQLELLNKEKDLIKQERKEYQQKQKLINKERLRQIKNTKHTL